MELLTDVLPLATLVLGILGTLTVEWLRGVASTRREREARLQLRAQVVKDKRDDFELKVLSDAYRELGRFARAVTRYHLLDRQAAVSLNTEYASRQLGGLPGEAEMGEELRLANRDTNAAVVLIPGDELREQVQGAVEALNNLGSSPRPVASADREYELASTKFFVALEAIGARVRAIYRQMT